MIPFFFPDFFKIGMNGLKCVRGGLFLKVGNFVGCVPMQYES